MSDSSKIPFPTIQFGDCPKYGKELTGWKTESDGSVYFDGSLYCSGCNKLPWSCDCKTLRPEERNKETNPGGSCPKVARTVPVLFKRRPSE